MEEEEEEGRERNPKCPGWARRTAHLTGDGWGGVTPMTQPRRRDPFSTPLPEPRSDVHLDEWFYCTALLCFVYKPFITSGN